MSYKGNIAYNSKKGVFNQTRSISENNNWNMIAYNVSIPISDEFFKYAEKTFEDLAGPLENRKVNAVYPSADEIMQLWEEFCEAHAS